MSSRVHRGNGRLPSRLLERVSRHSSTMQASKHTAHDLQQTIYRSGRSHASTFMSLRKLLRYLKRGYVLYITLANVCSMFLLKLWLISQYGLMDQDNTLYLYDEREHFIFKINISFYWIMLSLHYMCRYIGIKEIYVVPIPTC